MYLESLVLLILFYQVYSLREILIRGTSQITFKASDGDELTSDASKVLVLDKYCGMHLLYQFLKVKLVLRQKKKLYYLELK